MPNCFPKTEKLCGQLRISALYKEGKRFVAYPLRVTYRRIPDSADPPQVLIWAPKSLFKHATSRNRLRRLMREAYRLHAEPLRACCAEQNCSFQLAFNYMDRSELPYAQIEKAMRKALKRIIGGDKTE